MKDESCEVKMMMTQALEVILNKLVLNQVKEHEEWKWDFKDMNQKNSIKMCILRRG